MALVETRHPAVHQAFCQGLFSVQRGNAKFSLMAMDQNQEHCIQFLKDDGETKGLYGNPEEKEVVEISRAGILRALEEFELTELEIKSKSKNAEHPESSKAEQFKFLRHLQFLLNLFKDNRITNPFKELEPDLVTLDDGEIVDPQVAYCMRVVEETGAAMRNEYITKCV